MAALFRPILLGGGPGGFAIWGQYSTHDFSFTTDDLHIKGVIFQLGIKRSKACIALRLMEAPKEVSLLWLCQFSIPQITGLP